MNSTPGDFDFAAGASSVNFTRGGDADSTAREYAAKLRQEKSAARHSRPKPVGVDAGGPPDSAMFSAATSPAAPLRVTAEPLILYSRPLPWEIPDPFYRGESAAPVVWPGYYRGELHAIENDPHGHGLFVIDKPGDGAAYDSLSLSSSSSSSLFASSLFAFSLFALLN
jgi:hypothetical protein